MEFHFSLSAVSVNPPKQSAGYEPAAVKAPEQQKLPDKISTNSELVQAERQGAKVSIGQEQLIKAIAKAVKALEGPQTTLEISIHEKTHELMVKVLNKDTGELIREVPSEKTLNLVANMMEIAGILIDERV
ncbi:flagellar protein FlaG [Paenibacillus sp. DMB5]|uniref:flagellar protein FlaG n=1 Tax=Paenibacillus sp. DMB5 TaxID=1780103 RepID=UPI00076DB0D4|nr:flagellar protein FlaG [Paenibacillus sp. DMB5]KUP23873.1 flagellar biosynthesis protein FlaG [Paenibacillus sp. DMB5]